MTTLNHQPNHDHSSGDRSSVDELDRLLSGFFRSQVPTRWPEAPKPWDYEGPLVLPKPRVSRSNTRSRLALAASVALLLGTGLALSNRASDGKAKKGLDTDGTANINVIKDLGKTKETKTLPMP
jgi:hypothetical protein